jgi:hypothetical protein
VEFEEHNLNVEDGPNEDCQDLKGNERKDTTSLNLYYGDYATWSNLLYRSDDRI